MNIEKLAKHLQEFTLDEINMIAECDCKTELAYLLNSNKIYFEQGLYKYIQDNDKITYGIFIEQKIKSNNKNFEYGIKKFLLEYVTKYCSKRTLKKYKAVIKFDILPCILSNSIKKFDMEDIIQIYNFFMNRSYKPLRIKNTMALLKQILVFCKKNGYIDNFTNFQVRRVTNRNTFDINRIIFEE